MKIFINSTYIYRFYTLINRKNSLKSVENLDFNSLLSISEKKLLINFLEFQKSCENFKKENNTSAKTILNKLNNDFLIPVSIFTKQLSSLEIICKYLKEEKNLKNIEIASLIDRSSKSVWQAYNSSKKKYPKKFKIINSKYFIPISILKNKNLTVLENIVAYLKQFHNLNYSTIAKLLKRDDRTIWTVWHNVLKKRNN